ncbi:MAG TPA: SpoIVB peptidase [Bacilli bacterium]|nr:SpoIVB peptidase [Bacilli bacterium]
MIFKKLKKSFQILAFLIISIPTIAYAYSDYIIAGGENIGIEIKTNGIMIVGTYQTSKANNSSIQIGDKIITANSYNIESINDFTNVVNSGKCETLNVTYERNNKLYNTILDLALDDNGNCKTGLYVKDKITGIGTLTFIDPNTKIFGALGHEILEKTTGKIVETKHGTIFNSEVIGIEKSRNGQPGEKNARYYSNQVNGIIYENTQQGIFGNYSNDFSKEKLYKVAKKTDIKKGEAKIRTVLNGTEVKEYSIMITKLVSNQDTKNIYFDIVDKNLLENTGGIVQGMSGSPIIQGDYIIGAVTHVVVENPTKGYGIFITNMLEQAEN